jgi:single-stranded DNA-specific DHH superfamily exonuclease
LSKLGAAGDRIIEDDELGRQASILAASMGLHPKDDWMRYHILEMLVKGHTVWEMKEVKKRSNKAFAKLDEIAEKYDSIFENEMFVVRFYADGFGFAGKLANKLYKETKKIAFAVCYLDPEAPELLITGRQKGKSKFDLRKVFNKFPEWGGYGGGHRGAASGVIPKERWMDFCLMLGTLAREWKGD